MKRELAVTPQELPFFLTLSQSPQASYTSCSYHFLELTG